MSLYQNYNHHNHPNSTKSNESTLIVLITFHAVRCSGEYRITSPNQWAPPPKNAKTSVLAELNNALLHVQYKTSARGPVLLDIFQPKNHDTSSETAAPVIFFTHGGGWSVGNKSKAGKGGFGRVPQALWDKGFVVVSVGYRLVNKEIKHTTIRDCVVDCLDAARFIAAHSDTLGVNPQEFYTFGDSAGGHLAMMLLYCEPQHFLGAPTLASYDYKMRGGVSWYGPCNFQSIQLFNHNDSPNFRNRFESRLVGKATEEDKPSLFRELSPVTYITAQSPPLLMIQGDQDTTIPVKHAYHMQEHVKHVPAPVEVLIVKNAGHNWKPVGAPITPTTPEIEDQTISFLLNLQK